MARMAGELRYPLPAVLAVIGITEGTATNWLRRGYDGATIKGPGRGRRARSLGVSLIVRLAVMKRLADLGIPPSTAASWAVIALKTLEQGPFNTLRVIIRDGAAEVFLTDGMKVPPTPEPPIAEMTVTIRIKAMVGSLKASLADLAAINEEDGPPRRKRAAPSRRRRELADA